jgi:hemerythrin-like metal-binding protein
MTVGHVAGPVSHAVGWPAIDALHAECDRCVADFSATADSPPVLAALIEHLRHHFQTEEALMQASGFPPLGCHKREHDEVLAVVDRVHAMLIDGDTEVAQRLAAEFPRWFDAHATGMDALLAEWLRAQPPSSSLAVESAAT